MAVVRRDLIVNRLLIRTVAAAYNKPTWDLCVMIDYTFSSPQISVQPLTRLDNPKHPFYGGRKAIDEDRLRQNKGRLTAVLTKVMRGAELIPIWGYLVHHLLGDDIRSLDGGFSYNAASQALLMSQPDDSSSGNAREAMLALLGTSRRIRTPEAVAMPCLGILV